MVSRVACGGNEKSGVGEFLIHLIRCTSRTERIEWLVGAIVRKRLPTPFLASQELAVAGSDAMSATEAAKAANKALWEMVEPYDGFERWLECARRAVRFPSEGRCLLAGYKDCTGSTNARDHYYGHAAYTRLNGMLFNTSEIVKVLYET
jgi:hypothetical protein